MLWGYVTRAVFAFLVKTFPSFFRIFFLLKVSINNFCLLILGRFYKIKHWMMNIIRILKRLTLALCFYVRIRA